MTGPTGSGKHLDRVRLAYQACRQGHPVIQLGHRRVPRLFEEIRTSHGDGSYLKLLKRLAKTPILILDHWGLIAQDRADLLEIRNDWLNARSIVGSHLPPIPGTPISMNRPWRTPSWTDCFDPSENIPR